jgi:hypothetical protein
MTQSVIHQPRVAWDAARAFVRMAGGPHYEAFADRVRLGLGSQVSAELATTHQRLLAAAMQSGDRFATDVAAGQWRVRLEDLLRTDPSLVTPLRELTEAAAR